VHDRATCGQPVAQRFGECGAEQVRVEVGAPGVRERTQVGRRSTVEVGIAAGVVDQDVDVLGQSRDELGDLVGIGGIACDAPRADRLGGSCISSARRAVMTT
jgi:hypothetical protein